MTLRHASRGPPAPWAAHRLLLGIALRSGLAYDLDPSTRAHNHACIEWVDRAEVAAHAAAEKADSDAKQAVLQAEDTELEMEKADATRADHSTQLEMEKMALEKTMQEKEDNYTKVKGQKYMKRDDFR